MSNQSPKSILFQALIYDEKLLFIYLGNSETDLWASSYELAFFYLSNAEIHTRY